MDLETAHHYERSLEKTLKELDPKHKALKRIYHSTWYAIDVYQQAIIKARGIQKRLERKQNTD